MSSRRNVMSKSSSFYTAHIWTHLLSWMLHLDACELIPGFTPAAWGEFLLLACKAYPRNTRHWLAKPKRRGRPGYFGLTWSDRRDQLRPADHYMFIHRETGELLTLRDYGRCHDRRDAIAITTRGVQWVATLRALLD